MADEQNKSVGWVVGMLALAVLYFGWAFLASDYYVNTPGAGPGKANIWVNSITQLPNLPSVVGYAIRNRLWMVVLIAAGELGVLILWGILRKLERELWSS